MYTFELSEKFISSEERIIFKDFLQFYGINDGIWKVFECLFDAKTKRTVPLLLRVYENSDLAAVAVIIRCSKYGRSLYDNRLMDARRPGPGRPRPRTGRSIRVGPVAALPQPAPGRPAWPEASPGRGR